MEKSVIKAGTTLKSRSICDHNCIFVLKVISRTAKTAIVHDWMRGTRKTKIHVDDRGEFLMPERYSMAPTFRKEEV